MAALSTAMALVMIAQGILGLQWSPGSIQNNSMVYACATGTLSLPWSVTVAPGDTIVDISWFVSGKSQEMIATAAHGNFLAMPAFANRARQLAVAGVELDRLGVSDTGNYSVEVIGRTAAGVLTTLKNTVSVHVADGLQTTDGQLHINQQQEAEYDVTADQFYVVLRCGTFTYPTHPSFEVTWETPSGTNRSSSGYDNGSFYLRLDNPVQGGTYTCRLPPVSSCLHGHGSAVSASVDKTEALLLLMDAKIKELDTKDRALELANIDLVRQNNALQAALQGLQGSPKNDTSFLENRVRVLGDENQFLKVQQSSMKNDTSFLENRVRVLGEESQLLKLQLGFMKNRTAVLENQQNATEGLLSQTVSFQARLPWSPSVDVAASRTLVLPDVLRNHGDGYDNTTGVFTAPYSGTYCFLATAASYDDAADTHIDLYITVNNVNWANMETKAGLTRQPASMHAVVPLKAGDKDLATSTLILPDVLRNHGDGYDNTTGVFAAPYSGTYCFLATADSCRRLTDLSISSSTAWTWLTS